ncbi:MAG TPA: hypothetical protein VLA13_11240 [Massilibacterium sp.]|nr:hypothetical protein [Massilibacterium sp.]
MMFPQSPNARQWTLDEIDSLDIHFFYELMNEIEVQPQEKEVYLSEIW